MLIKANPINGCLGNSMGALRGHNVISLTLHENIRTHEIFTLDQILRNILGNYHQFSIKSYVVAIY